MRRLGSDETGEEEEVMDEDGDDGLLPALDCDGDKDGDVDPFKYEEVDSSNVRGLFLL